MRYLLYVVFILLPDLLGLLAAIWILVNLAHFALNFGSAVPASRFFLLSNFLKKAAKKKGK